MSVRIPFVACLISLGACAAACDTKTPTQPATTAAATATGLRITGLTTSAAVVGTTVPLGAIVSLSDGSEIPAPATGVIWSSSDVQVARVDAQGVLSAQAPGTVDVSVSAKGVTNRITISVVPDVAGKWTFDYVVDPCDRRFYEGPCPAHTGLVLIVTQSGDQLAGRSDHINFITGDVPVTGRINTDGAMTFSGVRCSFGDYTPNVRFALTDWQMSPAPNGTWSGRALWEQAGTSSFQNCDGPFRSVQTRTLTIINFRRAN